MHRRPNSASLRCEALEAREVPAIILSATVSGADAVPDGGFVNISELQLASSTMIFNRDGTVAAGQTKDANANDTLSFTLSNGTLTINSSDGIFGRVSNVGGNPIVTYGTTLTINNVTGLGVSLQLGGNDSITDSTTLGSTLDGGPGNDNINGIGGAINPLVLQLLASGSLNPVFLPTLNSMFPAKTLTGGEGDDTLTGAQVAFFTTLNGGNGNDTLIGGFGPDILNGGSGFDTLVGLGGGDYYLAQDFNPDFLFNQKGDIIFVDPNIDLFAVV